MRYFVIFLLLVISIIIPTSFAQQVPNCTFGSTTTPLQEKFANDFAVKEFVEQNPNAKKSIPDDESGNPRNQFALSAQTGQIQETLVLHFGIDEKGCYIPAKYHYSYNDGNIDVTIINTIGNFTEILNLIKSDSKTIDDFYPNGCSMVDLKHSISNGKIYGICKQGTSITVLADSYTEGIFTVDIPIEMVYSLPSSDCIPTGEFSVTDDIGSSKHEIAPSDIGNLVEVQLDEGFHRIRIGGYMILPSPSPGQYCGIVEGYHKPYLPPLDQIDHGMKPTSVKCNSGLVLIQKYDGSPACIKSESHKKLFERGWTKLVPIQPEIGKTGKYSLEIEDGSKFDLKYSIEGASLLSMTARGETESILINLDAPYNGSLTISIPRQIADAKDVNGIDDIPFFVLVEGEEVSSEEISSTSDTRTIIIPFEKRTKEIEIIGADYI